MDLLIVDDLAPQVLQWLQLRHVVRSLPSLARDVPALRLLARSARALVVPASVAVDHSLLRAAPLLRAVGRLTPGLEGVDIEACRHAGVEIVQAQHASAAAEAEFAFGAMLQLLRRVPVLGSDGRWSGRELCGCTVGIVGMTSAARPLAEMLAAFGVTTVGYDPALHADSALFARWHVRPLALDALFAVSDVVCVLLDVTSRHRGLLGERTLVQCKPAQVLVCLSMAAVFDVHALAELLATGRMAAAWFDCMEPGLREAGGPLQDIDTLQVTPRLAGSTHDSRLRAAWDVARRIDALLLPTPAPAPSSGSRVSAPLAHGMPLSPFRSSVAGAFADPAGG